MSVGQVVAVVSLLAQMYQVPEPLMQCVVYRESSYRVDAASGGNRTRLDTRRWRGFTGRRGNGGNRGQSILWYRRIGVGIRTCWDGSQMAGGDR